MTALTEERAVRSLPPTHSDSSAEGTAKGDGQGPPAVGSVAAAVSMWGGQVGARKRLTTDRAQSGEEAVSFAPLQLVAKGDVLPVASAAAVAAAVVAAEAPGELQLSTVRSSLDTAVVERMESRASGAEESFEAAPDSGRTVQMACDDRNYEINEESVSLHRAAPLP